MFGKRADGRLIHGLNGFFKTIPYIMPTRVDATNYINLEIDCRATSQFIHDRASEGRQISFMSVIIAAFVRTLAAYPCINRFVVNKRIYARNHIAVCFVVLKKDENGVEDETVVKIQCKATDTVFDIAEKVNAAIEENRQAGSNNAMDHLVDNLFRVPALAGFLLGVLRFLDRIGAIPRSLLDASPFHTSLFVTNMASIKMGSIFHHIYNFGTTGVFLSMGSKIKKDVIRHDNSRVVRQVMPLNVSVDERICSGAAFARMFFTFQRYLQNPELLAVPPETVVEDIR